MFTVGGSLGFVNVLTVHNLLLSEQGTCSRVQYIYIYIYLSFKNLNFTKFKEKEVDGIKIVYSISNL